LVLAVLGWVRLGGLGSAVPRGRHPRSRAGVPRYHLACRPARPGPSDRS